MPHKPYKRSRKDYPQGVIGIYDNHGQRNESADRYMVVFEPIENEIPRAFPPRIYPILTMSESPYSPQGVSLHGETDHRPTGGWQSGPNSAGKTISFADLPQDCQRIVLADLSES